MILLGVWVRISFVGGWFVFFVKMCLQRLEMGVAVEGVVGRWVFFKKTIGEGGLRVGSLRGVGDGLGFFGGRLGLWGVVGDCWEVVRAFE